MQERETTVYTIVERETDFGRKKHFEAGRKFLAVYVRARSISLSFPTTSYGFFQLLPKWTSYIILPLLTQFKTSNCRILWWEHCTKKKTPYIILVKKLLLQSRRVQGISYPNHQPATFYACIGHSILHQEIQRSPGNQDISAWNATWLSHDPSTYIRNIIYINSQSIPKYILSMIFDYEIISQKQTLMWMTTEAVKMVESRHSEHKIHTKSWVVLYMSGCASCGAGNDGGPSWRTPTLHAKLVGPRIEKSGHVTRHVGFGRLVAHERKFCDRCSTDS